MSCIYDYLPNAEKIFRAVFTIVNVSQVCLLCYKMQCGYIAMLERKYTFFYDFIRFIFAKKNIIDSSSGLAKSVQNKKEVCPVKLLCHAVRHSHAFPFCYPGDCNWFRYQCSQHMPL